MGDEVRELREELELAQHAQERAQDKLRLSQASNSQLKKEVAALKKAAEQSGSNGKTSKSDDLALSQRIADLERDLKAANQRATEAEDRSVDLDRLLAQQSAGAAGGGDPAQVRRLETDLQQAMTLADQRGAELQKATKAAGDLERELREAKQAIAAQVDAGQADPEEVATLKRQVQQANSRCARLERFKLQVGSLEAKLRDMDEEGQAAKAAEAEARVEQAERRTAEADWKAAGLSSTLEEVRAALEGTKASLQEAESRVEEASALRGQIQALEGRSESLAQQLQAAQQDLADAQQARAAAQEKKDQAVAAAEEQAAQLAVVQQKLAEAERTCAALHQGVGQAQAASEESGAGDAQLAEVQQQLAEAERTCAALRRDKDQALAAAGEAGARAVQLAEVQQQLSDSERAREALQQDKDRAITAANAARSEACQIQAELESRSQGLERELGARCGELEQERVRTAQLEASVQAAVARAEQLEVTVAAVEEQKAVAASGEAEALERAFQAEDALADSQAKLQAQEAALNQAGDQSQKAQDAMSEVEVMRKELDVARAEMAAMRARVRELESASPMELAAPADTDAKEELARKTRRVAELQGFLDDQTQAAQRFEASFVTAEEARKKAQQQLEEVKRQATNDTGRVQELESQLDAATTREEELEARLAAVSLRVKAADSRGPEFQALEAQLAEDRKQRVQWQQKAAELEGKLQQALAGNGAAAASAQQGTKAEQALTDVTAENQVLREELRRVKDNEQCLQNELEEMQARQRDLVDIVGSHNMQLYDLKNKLEEAEERASKVEQAATANIAAARAGGEAPPAWRGNEGATPLYVYRSPEIPRTVPLGPVRVAMPNDAGGQSWTPYRQRPEASPQEREAPMARPIQLGGYATPYLSAPQLPSVQSLPQASVRSGSPVEFMRGRPDGQMFPPNVAGASPVPRRPEGPMLPKGMQRAGQPMGPGNSQMRSSSPVEVISWPQQNMYRLVSPNTPPPNPSAV